MNYICKRDYLSIRRMLNCNEDYSLLAKWLSDPAVLEYYEGKNNPFDLEKVIKKWGPRVRGEKAVIRCILEYKERAVGYIQYYRTNSDDYELKEKINLDTYKLPFGIDLFIGEIDYWNRGLGTKFIKMFVKYLFDNEKADIILIDPQTWNKRAIRCYEKAGFKALGIIKNRELFDGEYKDNLIMGMLSIN
ncbi:GNAT family N-acetyltransferase [Clostridium oryzae]|uniref:Bifunctional AAC/APH n=1 Tax=Clostridium oryzae TaxID=1450648 RepID=A0A1V4IWH4_9CLOT|nr:GNAT family N-acetyltransferase [Clostridium oryzae]OPJ64124.1 bifunctional AAC/APH [Clostridium oryzae]